MCKERQHGRYRGKDRIKIEVFRFLCEGFNKQLAGGNDCELKRKEKIIQEGIQVVHALKYIGLEEKITEGLNEDVIEQWEKDVNHRASRFEDMLESITNAISEIEDKVRENMFAQRHKGTKEIRREKVIGRNEKRGKGE